MGHVVFFNSLRLLSSSSSPHYFAYEECCMAYLCLVVPVLLSSPPRAGDKAYLDRMGCRLLLLICLLVVINCFVFVLSSGWL